MGRVDGAVTVLMMSDELLIKSIPSAPAVGHMQLTFSLGGNGGTGMHHLLSDGFYVMRDE